MSRRAIVCSYGPPRHDRDSGSRRLWHLIGFLRDAGWSVSFLSASKVEDPRYAADLLRSAVPLYDGTATRVDDLLASGDFDLALCAFWQVAELYLPVFRDVSPSTAVIVDSVDLQLVRDARRILSRGAGTARLLDADYGDETIGELNVYAAADGVLTVSAEEARLVGGLLGDHASVHVVPDAEDIERSPVPFAERCGIVFVGSFRHTPNVDALDYFCREVVPLLDPTLLEKHPVSVVGEGLSGAVCAPALGLEHVNLVGWVPELEPYLAQALMTVVPLRFGAGTKRKMIQALMVGTPTVATTIGVEGLDLEDGEHALVADDADSFARAIARLAEDEALWQRLSRQGSTHVGKDHRPAAVNDRFLAVVEETLSVPRKPALLPFLRRESYERRTMYQLSQQTMPAVRELCRTVIPPGSDVLVISGGSSELLALEGVQARHFPCHENGEHSTTNPDESSQAIEWVEEHAARGAEFLVVPKMFDWWLRHYPELREHLEAGPGAWHDDSCTIFDLRRGERQAAALRSATRAPVKLVAFYLPQFHPIPENDQWWGEGFTEWTNVAKAEPLFGGHYQPHLPADLGFYDLRLPGVREAQAALARKVGIEAFCYYHYWFGGKRLLERPFDEVLASGSPDFRFCLCWANEPWSRRWHGREEDVLQAQTYSEQDDLEHIRWLLPALRDPRALTVEGNPVFVVYQAKDLPDPARTADLWRREVRKAGLPGLHLVSIETGWDAGWDATEVGFDAKILFQPQFSLLQTVPQLDVDGPEDLRVFDYEQAWPVLSRPDPVPYRRYETVCAGWDNSPRTGERGWVLHDSTPEAYEQWLRAAVERALHEPPEHRLVFLNAWNEWAEGAHLEPDQRHGLAYLEATRRALESADARPTTEPRPAAPAESDEPPSLDPLEGVEPPRARALALYLPQFHPIPENDQWWGKGFTEWTNVARARPLFEGHYQPHLPAHLGFYDLRSPEIREQQAALATEHGVEGFCYWHYWFLGKRLLEHPFEEVLASGSPDFPFCLAWANETWSRRWLGEERDILMKQEYSPQDDLEHARWLTAAFGDPRYVRVFGRPLFVVYRPTDLPDPERTTELWKETCVQAGLPEPYLLGMNSHRDLDFRDLGFDGTINFEPQLGAVVDPLSDGLKVVDYTEARQAMRRGRGFDVYPTIVTRWDNTPRRGEHGVVFDNATPASFEQGLRDAVESVAARPFEDRLVFLNAWNEWAEGNHLEPDARFGLGYLEAVRRVILERRRPTRRPVVSASAAQHRDG